MLLSGGGRDGEQRDPEFDVLLEVWYAEMPTIEARGKTLCTPVVRREIRAIGKKGLRRLLHALRPDRSAGVNQSALPCLHRAGVSARQHQDRQTITSSRSEHAGLFPGQLRVGEVSPPRHFNKVVHGEAGATPEQAQIAMRGQPVDA